MSESEILSLKTSKTVLKLSDQCRSEQDLEPVENFTINRIIGDFKQVEIMNQFGQKMLINPDQLN